MTSYIRVRLPRRTVGLPALGRRNPAIPLGPVRRQTCMFLFNVFVPTPHVTRESIPDVVPRKIRFGLHEKTGEDRHLLPTHVGLLLWVGVWHAVKGRVVT